MAIGSDLLGEKPEKWNSDKSRPSRLSRQPNETPHKAVAACGPTGIQRDDLQFHWG